MESPISIYSKLSVFGLGQVRVLYEDFTTLLTVLRPRSTSNNPEAFRNDHIDIALLRFHANDGVHRSLPARAASDGPEATVLGYGMKFGRLD